MAQSGCLIYSHCARISGRKKDEDGKSFFKSLLLEALSGLRSVLFPETDLCFFHVNYVESIDGYGTTHSSLQTWGLGGL